MEAQKVNSRVALRVLLCVVLAGWSGAILSCKSAPQSPLATADGLKVTMDMTVMLPDKTVALSTVGKEPLSFIQGKHDILPSLEIALAGMKPGEKKTVHVPSEQAYGPYDEAKKRTVKLEQLPPGTKIGARVRSKDGAVARVVTISDGSVVIDFNDPLAGKDLTYEITVLKVEKP
jgi:FKBP-type peptidyl-prolyl cis-trans isomerase 2